MQELVYNCQLGFFQNCTVDRLGDWNWNRNWNWDPVEAERKNKDRIRIAYFAAPEFYDRIQFKKI